MTRPAREEPYNARLYTNIPERYAVAVEQLAKAQLTDSSTLVRQGVLMMLRQFNALPPAPNPMQRG